MKLSTGMNVLVGPNMQPAQVMSNGFTVHYTRSVDRYHAQAPGKKLHPGMAREVKEIEDTGIVRSGFHKFPGETAHKPGYVQVLIRGRELSTVRMNKIHPVK